MRDQAKRGGRQARLSHRLKPLGTAMECRATVAQRRRDPSKAEECVRLASSGERVVEANGRAPTRAQLLATARWRSPVLRVLAG